MPNSNLLASLFGRSPIDPINAHITTVHRCVLTLEPFFQAVISNEWDTAYHTEARISTQLEEAGKIKRNIHRQLPDSLYLPVARGDLLALLVIQDNMARQVKEMVTLVVERKMEIPTALHAIFMSALHSLVALSKQSLDAVSELEGLVETGFQGREVVIVESMLGELDSLERITAKSLSTVRIQLFDLESELAPVDIVFLYKLMDWLGELTRSAAQVGGHLQLLLAR